MQLAMPFNFRQLREKGCFWGRVEQAKCRLLPNHKEVDVGEKSKGAGSTRRLRGGEALQLTRVLLTVVFVGLLGGTTLADQSKPEKNLKGETTASVNLVKNSGFERGLEGWSKFWSREPGAGAAVVVQQERHSGTKAVRLTHTGRLDWSFSPNLTLQVKSGELIELQAWVKHKGEGTFTLAAIAYDQKGNVVSWIYGGRERDGKDTGWKLIRTRILVGPNVVRLEPRFTGHGPQTLWIDDVSVVRAGSVDSLRQRNLPKSLTIRNSFLEMSLNTTNGTFQVRDLRTQRLWTQRPSADVGIVLSGQAQKRTLRWEWFVPYLDLQVHVTATMEPDVPEILVTLSAEGALPSALKYPYPFVTEPGTYLVVPMNEGISYPVDDEAVEPLRLVAYGGHGICMAFWGATDGRNAYEGIFETADDAAIRIARIQGKLYIAPEWDPQKGQFGYPRRIRYVFFDKGGHVAMCKRYRKEMQKQGRLVTLSEKRKRNPNVDLLIGAVNVWCWEKDALGIVQELQKAGIQRILWSSRQKPEVIKAMNQLGVLTSRYDIYQDVMNPANFPKLYGVHSDWVTEAWPKDLILDAHGDWVRGWRVKGKDGKWYPCGVLCDTQALKYARKRVPVELKTHPYRCRFIDTTTAAAWRECYNPAHPMTRTDSRRWRMRLLEFMSRDMNLVTGSETGHDAAVPFLHYFEGMLSLAFYRVPDSGRNMLKIWDTVPERVAKFQVGQRYRLPLWELVYHDCVVAQWYWGDYNNKIPAIWLKRDLFNTLYGTPPMFMFTKQYWRKHKQRFVASYRRISPVARATGYAEMVDHRFLSPDRNVQQTRFANGVTVTVNFGNKPFRLENGVVVAPHDSYVSGIH